MATLYIVEFDNLGLDTRGLTVLTGAEPAINIQQVSFGGGNTLSQPLNPATRFVEIQTDTTCQILFGDSPDARRGGERIFANGLVFRAVQRPGLVISVTQSG